MTELKSTRRDAIRSFLVFPLVAPGLVALSGCGESEKSFPVIPTNKSKEQFESDIDNPFGLPEPKGKGKSKAKRK